MTFLFSGVMLRSIDGAHYILTDRFKLRTRTQTGSCQVPVMDDAEQQSTCILQRVQESMCKIQSSSWPVDFGSRPTSSTANTRAALPGMTPPYPREPVDVTKCSATEKRKETRMKLHTVCHTRWDSQGALLIEAHANESFIPASDDLAHAD